jgi:hypothetical protein
MLTSRVGTSFVVGLVCLSGCLAPPKLDGDVVVGTSGVDVYGSDESPYTTGEPAVDVGGSTSDAATGVVDDASTGDAPAMPDVGNDDDTADPTGEPGELPPGYPTEQPFGDDVRELDLVGHWVVPWNPAGVAHVELVVDASGGFAWRERDAGCGIVGAADGSLWVDGGQLVFAVDAWDKAMPWDTQAGVGIEIAAPFRMRVGYTPMGGFLGFAAPVDFTSVFPWEGRAYARLDASAGPVGAWAGEAELWATPPDADAPALIVRDRREADVLQTAFAHVASERTWWWPQGPDVEEGEAVTASWIDETPGNLAGAAVIADVRHAYDGTGLITFSPQMAFALVGASPCP